VGKPGNGLASSCLERRRLLRHCPPLAAVSALEAAA